MDSPVAFIFVVFCWRLLKNFGLYVFLNCTQMLYLLLKFTNKDIFNIYDYSYTYIYKNVIIHTQTNIIVQFLFPFMQWLYLQYAINIQKYILNNKCMKFQNNLWILQFFFNILYKISNFKPLLLFIFFKPIYTIEFFYDQAKIMFCNITTQKDTNQQ